MKGAAFVLAGAVVGAAVTLAILAVVIPARLFGVSGEALAYSISPVESESCDRVGRARWHCELFDGGESLPYFYSVVVSPDGCWEARSQSAEPLHGCIGLLEHDVCLRPWAEKNAGTEEEVEYVYRAWDSSPDHPDRPARRLRLLEQERCQVLRGAGPDT